MANPLHPSHQPAPTTHPPQSPTCIPCPPDLSPLVKHLRAVVFDFDGTLAHTRIDFAQMRARSLDYIRKAGLWTDAVAAAPYVLEAIERAAQSLPSSDRNAFLAGANQILEEIEVEACATGQPFPRVPEALASLSAAGLRLAVITRNCSRAVAVFVRRHPLPIDVLLTRDDVPRVKPDPDHLMRALQRLDLRPDQAMMVGDHRADIQCAVAAGVPACGVLTAGASAQELYEAGARFVLDDVPTLAYSILHALPGTRHV